MTMVRASRPSLFIRICPSVDGQGTYLLGSFEFSHVTLKDPLDGVIDFHLQAGDVELLKPERNRNWIIRTEMRDIQQIC